MPQTTPPLYPLRFVPLFKRYLWGGRRLGTFLGKPIGTGDDYAESWELVDRAGETSVVHGGWLDGATIAEVIGQYGEAIPGPVAWQRIHNPNLPAALRGRFPLLLKYLDAHKPLSVQVHPDDAMAARLPQPDLGKTEAWYVLDAEPGSLLYAGLRQGVGPRELQAAVDAGRTDDLLHPIEARPGDCIFIPAGTVHAIGAGLLIAEIQQCSDTTFRLFDWNRVDREGRARPLHVEQAIAATNFDRGPVAVQVPRPGGPGEAEELVRCDKFVLNRVTLDRGSSFSVETKDGFRIVTVVRGEVSLAGDPIEQPLRLGETALIPASLACVTATAGEGCQLLIISAGMLA